MVNPYDTIVDYSRLFITYFCRYQTNFPSLRMNWLYYQKYYLYCKFPYMYEYTYTIIVHDVTISIYYQLCSVFELCHKFKFCIDFLKMENEIRRITSERGNDLLLVNGHKFRFIRQRADGYVTFCIFYY